jgi:RND family efflux transporter MFP subunit
MIGRILRFIAPLFVFLVFGIIGFALLNTRPSAPRTPTFAVAPLVTVEISKTHTIPRTIEGMGTVIPAKQVALQAEVSGKIITASPQLVPGGLVSEGDVLAIVDPRDYEAAVVQAEATLAQARFQWKLEEGRKHVAEREWELLDDASAATGKGRDLALRKPHLASAKATMKAARSGLERARMALERTELTAPFNAIIQSEEIEKGQVITPASRAAVLVGTDMFWAQIAIPVDQVQHLTASDEGGSSVRLKQSTGGDAILRDGRVVRVLGDLDPRGRMARIMVAISDPLGLQSELAALRLGAYVEASVVATPLNQVTSLPRLALRNNSQVWLAEDDDTLAILDVNVVWRDRDQVHVHGIQNGKRIIISDLSAPIRGMTLQVDASPGASIVDRESSP